MKTHARVAAFVILLLSAVRVSGQQVEIRGIVTDSLGIPLQYATVQLIDADGNIPAYAIANDKGEYVIRVSEQGIFTVRVASLGNYPSEKTIVVDPSAAIRLQLNFALQRNPYVLKEVVVSKEIAARVRSDTITYNIGKYLSGNEKVLKDVLNKLPGIEVKEDGKVKAYGKDVDKILVEGDDFFSDQQNVAVENLSADAISQVQVLNNFQPNTLMKEFSQGGQTALNINIRDEYRNKLSGNISAAGGYRNKYNGASNLYSIGKTLKSTLIAGANNTGEETFSMHDYMSFGGGIGQMMENSENSGGLVQINPGEISLGIGGGKDANRKNTSVGAFNMTYKPGVKLKLTGSILASGTNRNEYEQILRSFYSQNEGSLQKDLTSVSRRLFLGSINMNAVYKPRNGMQFTYKLSAGNRIADNTGVIASEGVRNLTLNESADLNNTKISQYLDYTLKFSSTILLNAGVFYEYQSRLLTENLSSASSFLGFGFSAPPYVISQDIQAINNHSGINISFSWKPGAFIFKSVSGVSSVRQSFESALVQGSEPEMADISGFGNDLSYSVDNYRTAVYVSKNKGLVQFNAGPVLQYYKARVSSGAGFRKPVITPDLRFSLKFSDTHNLNISFSRKLTLPSAEEMVQNNYLKDYRTIASGGLTPADYTLSSQFNGHYMLFDAFSNTLFSAGAYYIKRVSPVSAVSGNGTEFNTRRAAVVPFDETFGAMLYFDKRFRKLPVTLRLNSNFSRSYGYNFILDQLNAISRNSISASAAILTRFNFPANFESGSSVSQVMSSGRLAAFKNCFSSLQPFARLHVYHKAGLTGLIGFSYPVFKSEFQTKRYEVLDATLRFRKPSSPFEYSISVSNVLNISDYRGVDTQVMENYYLERQYGVLPGYILLRIKYTITGMNLP